MLKKRYPAPVNSCISPVLDVGKELAPESDINRLKFLDGLNLLQWLSFYGIHVKGIGCKL